MTPKSVEWHAATGRALKEVHRLLTNLSVTMAAGYGKTSTTAKRAKRAADAVSRLRSNLDDEFYKGHPGAFNGNVYFGG